MIWRLSILSLACLAAPARGQTTGQAIRQVRYDLSDSIRLERLPGGWGGPEYQIVIDKHGRVSVRPDSMRRHFRLPRKAELEGFYNITAYATITGFAELPDSVEQHAVFGRFCGTDQPTTIVTIFNPTFRKRVVDYQGCRWVPVGLRDLEDAIDRMAGRRR